jgi:hypothetical protein
VSSINQGTINNAARGDKEAMRVLLNAFSYQLEALAQGTGVQLLEPTSGGKQQTPVVGVPPQATLAVTGENGVFSISITPPAQTIAATLYHEVSYATSPSFAAGATTLPLTPATSFTLAIPGTTYYWRVRSTYNRKNFNAYRLASTVPVASGLQSSSAVSNNVALNQSNYAYVDSVDAGTSANVRVYGSGGPGSAWVGMKGTQQTRYPSATIINVPYLSEWFVAWDGSQYRLLPNLPGVFPDEWVLVGKVSVVGSGTVVQPTITANVTGGGITSFTVTSPGNGLSDPVTITITDPTGSGATAGAQHISGGHLISVDPGLPGSGYTAPVVTTSGGTFGGEGGGGTALGGNGGRLTAV